MTAGTTKLSVAMFHRMWLPATCVVAAMFWGVQTATQTPAQSSITLPPDLDRVLRDYEVAWQKRDAAALAGLFAEDGFVLSGNTDPVRGRVQIQKHYTGQGGSLALRAFAFAVDGNVGYIIGGYARQKDEPDAGKFTLTLRKNAEGRWLIVSDMDNANARPRQP
jgi:ketosteroid isomerase-like protein